MEEVSVEKWKSGRVVPWKGEVTHEPGIVEYGEL